MEFMSHPASPCSAPGLAAIESLSGTDYVENVNVRFADEFAVLIRTNAM